MSGAPAHGRAARSPNAVCGADDGPVTRITDEPHLVTCPDCIDYADIEALPDDAVSGDLHLIECLRQAARGRFRKIDGVPVDATTAAAILTVYDAASPATRARLAQLPLTRLAEVCWRILRPHL
ncbi:MAG: hypothetical protein HKP61_00435 [Dactylosporangium sp.]|nr:hypothetical protein [Dactylosporangium sp.]NNJ59439.1 hypothetical protein [Dactylosporangium sp.]